MILFRDVDNYLELHLAMKIPISILKDSNVEVRRYKYHVESSATENNMLESLELIPGPHAQTGFGTIDRSLKSYFDHDKVQLNGKQQKRTLVYYF